MGQRSGANAHCVPPACPPPCPCSRGGVDASRIPCTVSLSHLVLVLEVILPVLFVAWFDSTAAAWFGGSGGGGNSSEAQHVPLGSNEAGPGAALAPAPGTSAATPRLEAPRRLAARRGAPPSYPSPLLALMFGLGLAGVLFDVLLTVHNRPAAPPGS